jgi:NADH dehydrogenase FAD-containing subunit
MDEKRDVLVIGGGYAGVLAATRLARKGGAKVAVTLVNERPAFVERIRLHERAARAEERPVLLEHLVGPSVRVHVGRVSTVDLATRTARIAADGAVETRRFDELLLAVGSVGSDGGVLGVREHAHSLATAEQARRLLAALSALPPGATVVVCGGGLTAIEAATELAEAYPQLHVKLVTGGRVAPGVSSGGRRYVLEVMASLGITVHEEAVVEAVDPHRVVCAGGTSLQADLTLWACGFRAPSLMRNIGLAVQPDGRARVDAFLRSTSHPFVRVIGDAAAVGPQDACLRMSCQAAMPMGAYAADDVAARLSGQNAGPFRFGFSAQCISLGRKRGLVQMVNPDDTPSDRMFTGRPGAILKELVCRFTVLMLRAERRGFEYRWPRSKNILPEGAPAVLQERAA